MNEIPFYKFDGAGNDFVLVDIRESHLHLTQEQIAKICHRRFGVGADGLMTLDNAADGFDFAMTYFNSDGGMAAMCGNGARCIVAFAHCLGVIGMNTRFLATDGPHEAAILEWDEKEKNGVVRVGMKDVEAAGVKRCLDGWLLNTGVPHYVQEVKALDSVDVKTEGRRIRHLPELGPEGANVNFVERQADGCLKIRTYERGVEDETWACGTGVTASAIVSGVERIEALGGKFKVTYVKSAEDYRNIQLEGPVSLNFVGTINI